MSQRLLSFVLVCLSLFMATMVRLQALDWEWARQTGGAMNLGAVRTLSGMCTDSEGNCVICGFYSDSTTVAGQTFPGRGSAFSDAFVAKYSTSGKELWAKRIYAPKGAFVIVQSSNIVCDAANNVYVVGTAAGEIHIENIVLQSGTFLAKYTADGSLVFAKTLGRLGAASLCLDSKQNLCLLGAFNGGTISVDGLQLEGNGKDYCVAKFKNDGTVRWAHVVRGTLFAQTNQIGAIRCDGKDNIYICGDYSDTLDFGNSVTLGNGESIYDFFVAKLDGDGKAQWAINCGAKGAQDHLRGMQVNNAGDVYLIGSMSKNARIADTGTEGSGVSNAFVAKLSTDAKLVWYRVVLNGQDCGGSIVLDGTDDVIIAGQFGGTMKIGDSTLQAGGAAFIAKYDAEGKALWAACPPENLISTNNCLAINAAGSIFIGGSFAGTIRFGSNSLHTGFDTDPLKFQLYVAKLNGLGAAVEELGIAQLYEPAKASILKSTPVTFKWSNVPGAASYELELSTDSLFSGSSVKSYSHLSDTTLVLSDFVQNRVYYWRVRAFSTQSSKSEIVIQSQSSWSTTYWFTLEASNPVFSANNSASTVLFYPLPFSTHLSMYCDLSQSTKLRLCFYDICGAKALEFVRSSDLGESLNQQIDTTALPPGIYFYELETASMRARGAVVKE